MEESSINPPDWVPEVSGYYGPGTYLAWLLVMASLPITLFHRRANPSPPSRFPPADLIATVLYPVVAGGDAVLRLADRSINWDRIREDCPLFEVGLGRVKDTNIIDLSRSTLQSSPEDLVSRCLRLQLALDVVHFFHGLCYICILVAIVWNFFHRLRLPRHGRTAWLAVLAVPPLWCFAVGVGALARVRPDRATVLFFLFAVTPLVKLVAILAMVIAPLVMFYFALLGVIFLVWAALECYAIIRRKPGMTVRDRMVFVLGYAFFGACPFLFVLWAYGSWTSPSLEAIVFLDELAGISISELDQAAAACGGLVTFLYAAHNAGVLLWPFKAVYRFVRVSIVTYKTGLDRRSRP